MAQVPVDIRVDKTAWVFRKLEKSFQKLDKMADDIRLQMKERLALRQLQKVGREVDVLASSIRGIDVDFDVKYRICAGRKGLLDAVQV